MPKQSKYYAVVKGKKPGIYNTWAECTSQVSGYSGAIFKSFKSRDDAVQYYQMHVPPAPRPPKRQPPTVATATAEVAPHSYSHGFYPVDPPARTMNSKILSIRIMFDGGSRGNPGQIAGAGAVVTIDTTTTNSNTTSSGDNTTTTTYRVRQFLGDNHQSITNNQAEYSGCQIGLRVALFHMQREQRLARRRRRCQPPIKGGSLYTKSDGDMWVDSIEIQGDSQLIINQLNQSYKCKNAQLMVYYEKCQSYLQELVSLSSSPNNEEETNVLIEHVYRDQNKEADELANEAMDQKRSYMTTSKDNHQQEYKLPLDLIAD